MAAFAARAARSSLGGSWGGSGAGASGSRGFGRIASPTPRSDVLCFRPFCLPGPCQTHQPLPSSCVIPKRAETENLIIDLVMEKDD